MDIRTAAIGAAGALLMVRFRIPEPVIVAGAAVAGILLYQRRSG